MNVASGAVVVLTATVIFLVVFMLAPQRGIVWEWVRRLRLQSA
ncbi:MAG: hypothetical protein MUP64_09905 [Anaerolineae bacterium]|nr:hypothetical protein [Anaerolineae bacterium]